MSSIRKPKRLTIRGDDEKEYMFLVKGGEDLRMDQRIEQVLALLFCYIHSQNDYCLSCSKRANE